MSVPFVDGGKAIHGILTLALAAVEAGKLDPFVEVNDPPLLRIVLGLSEKSDAFLRLERDNNGDLWVTVVNLLNEPVDLWHELEVTLGRGEAREHSTLRRLWRVCRSRCYPAETEEILALLEQQFSEATLDV